MQWLRSAVSVGVDTVGLQYSRLAWTTQGDAETISETKKSELSLVLPFFFFFETEPQRKINFITRLHPVLLTYLCPSKQYIISLCTYILLLTYICAN